MNIDDLIRHQANKLRSAHARQVAPGLEPRQTRRTWAVVLGAAAVVLLLITPVALLLRSNPEVGPAQAPSTTVPASLPGTTLPGETTSTLSTVAPATPPDVQTTVATTTPVAEPAGGWEQILIDPEMFGGGTITAAASDGSRLVLAGCEGVDRDVPGVPLWWSDDAETWQRADGPDDVRCLTLVEATPFGFFAASPSPIGLLAPGGSSSLWSADGRRWELLELAVDFGFAVPGRLQAVFVSPIEDRLTLLLSGPAPGESTVATLVTTTDGVNWTTGPAESAMLFDNADIADVIEGGDGLLAVGASPGGQFVPTAAVFTSADGLSWRRVTPQNPDFDNKVMGAVLKSEDQFVAVGGDFSQTGLMTAWTSPDGIAWTRSPDPDESTDPSVAFMTAQAITAVDGTIWAAGVDSDARRDLEGPLLAIWSSPDGRSWSRVDIEGIDGPIPFVLFDTGDLRLGVWPPPYSPIDDAIQIFRSQ